MNNNQLEEINKAFTKIAVVAGVAADSLMRIFNEFSNAVAVAINPIFTDDFVHKLAIEVKKERHRKRYCRAMERRKK